jgi:hypothetical protein
VVRQDYCGADLGSVTIVGEGPFIRIDGENILSFHIGEGNLEISLWLFSETDDLLLDIDRNEWIAGDSIGKVSLGPSPQNPHAMFVAWRNRRERLWKARDEWRKIKAKSTAGQS